MEKFRFENLVIWKESIELSIELFELSEKLAEEKKFRFADQLSGAVLSISNNIAEGSGSSSAKEFARYLMIARSSVFEVSSMIQVLYRIAWLKDSEKDYFYMKLSKLSKQISAFRKSLMG